MTISLPYIIYSINERISGRNTLQLYRKLKEIESYPEEKLRDWQFKKLKALLVHSYRYVEHYKEAFDRAGFAPEKMSCLEDLQNVPLLAKEEMRGSEREFISKDKRRETTRYATSGSTGHPLIFYISNERFSGNRAAYLLLYSIWGLKIGDKEAVFWGSSRDISAYSVAKKVRDGLMRTHLMPAFKMDEGTMKDYIDFIRRYRPANIFGYAHSVYLLARFAKNRDLRLDGLGIRVVFTTAELLHDYQRQLIEEVFGCPVSDCYGGRDSGLVAFECPSKSMHVNPAMIAESIKDGKRAGPGETGEIVITDLFSYGTPFVRYRTGDHGIVSGKKGCPCGRNLPIIENITGRDTDYIVGPKGEFIHPLALEYIFREIEGIDYFRIVQKREDELAIDLAVNEKFDKDLEGSIRGKIVGVMGPVTVRFNFIGKDEIPAQDKYKFVVSEVIKKYL